jgi:hypothetical protein
MEYNRSTDYQLWLCLTKPTQTIGERAWSQVEHCRRRGRTESQMEREVMGRHIAAREHFGLPYNPPPYEIAGVYELTAEEPRISADQRRYRMNSKVKPWRLEPIYYKF